VANQISDNWPNIGEKTLKYRYRFLQNDISQSLVYTFHANNVSEPSDFFFQPKNYRIRPKEYLKVLNREGGSVSVTHLGFELISKSEKRKRLIFYERRHGSILTE